MKTIEFYWEDGTTTEVRSDKKMTKSAILGYVKTALETGKCVSIKIMAQQKFHISGNTCECETCQNLHSECCRNCSVNEYHGKRVGRPTQYKHMSGKE